MPVIWPLHMSDTHILYRKALDLPIYYLLDKKRGKIESLKDWPDQPKELDVYPWYEEFAQNITDAYEPVSAETFRAIRAYICLSLQPPCSHRDFMAQPGATAS